MCTLSYYPLDKDSYSIRFSRDESIRRKAASAPQVHVVGDMYAIYPQDKIGDGTWIAVQSDGTSFFLLNGNTQQPGAKKHGTRSRARVIMKLLGCRSETEVRMKVRSLTLKNYSPFVLVAVVRHPGVGFKILTWEWNGSTLQSFHNLSGPLLWASSSVDEAQVKRFRKDAWIRFLQEHPSPDEERLRTFHFPPEPHSHMTVAMKRSEHQTHSVSEIHVSPDGIRFIYFDGPPWEVHEGVQKVMPRPQEESRPSVLPARHPAL